MGGPFATELRALQYVRLPCNRLPRNAGSIRETASENGAGTAGALEHEYLKSYRLVEELEKNEVDRDGAGDAAHGRNERVESLRRRVEAATRKKRLSDLLHRQLRCACP